MSVFLSGFCFEKFILLISISFHIIEADEGAAVLSLCRNLHSSAELGELFAGRKITQDEKFWEYLNQYDVICLNMQQFLFEADALELTNYLEQEVLRELGKEYGACLSRENKFSAYSIF